MARIAYWIVNLSADWPGDGVTGTQIAAGNLSDNSAADFAGSEDFSATGGTGTITEATAITLSASTAYKIAWTIYDDVSLTYATPVVGEFTTDAAALDLDPAALALSGSISVAGDIQIGTSFDVSASAVALSGALAVSGDIQITEAPELDLDPATLALSGALSISGDLQIGTGFDLAADPVALSGSLAVSGDIESSVDPILDIDAAPVALAGSLGVSGDIQIGTSFDIAATAVALAGSIGVAGDIEVGTSFDLAADPVALSGALAVSGDIEAIDQPASSGILEIEWDTGLWWQRKPKAMPDPVAKARLKKAAKAIAKKAEEQVKASVIADEPVRKAEARKAVRPMLREMPGFDWQALYDEAYSRALNAAIAQAMRESDAMAQAQAAIERARLLDDEDVEILMALL